MRDSIQARQARKEAEQRRTAREAMAERGPYLTDDKATVVIPSPAYHPALTRILKEYGFTFERGLLPWWERPTAKPHQGKHYTPDGWLKWAKRHYAKAWPEIVPD